MRDHSTTSTTQVCPQQHRRPWLSRAENASIRIMTTLVLLCGCLSSVAWSATPQPVEEFMKLKNKWNDLVGSKFFLEGRFSGSADNVFGLMHCPLEFRVKERVPKYEPRKDVLEITGELARDERSMLIYMKVESLRKLESDERTMIRRKGELPIDIPDGWYDLGNWARMRGEYYKDNDLLTAGRDCFERGIQIERRDRKRRTPELLEELSRKASELLSDESVRLQILHDAWQMRWEESQPRLKPDEMLGFGQSLPKVFAFGNTVLKPEEAELQDKYWKSPVAVYDANESDRTLDTSLKEARRRMFHRVFYVKIVQQALAKKAKADGSNGKEIASLTEALIPEHAQFAAEQRRKEFDYRIAGSTKMSWAELTALRTELTQASRPEDARRAFDLWMNYQEQTRRKRGHIGLMELAEMYEEIEELQPRRFKAVEYLLEAEKLNPGLPGVTERLAKYGYQRVDGQLMTKEEAVAAMNTPIAVAIREGRVMVGMTPLQVEKSVGKPASVTRFLTSKTVKEYWLYTDAKFSVKLERQTHRSDAVVTAISELAN